jgi:RHS repeat-associated protein
MRFTRNAVGQITRESLGGVLDRDLSYHPDGYLTGQRVVAGGRPLFEQKYRYDGAGNMIAKYDSLSGVERYLYDPLSRLVAQLDPEGRLRRILNDPVGDRLGTGSHDASGDSDWRRQGEYNGTTYRFDRAGSLIERAGLGAMLHLSWDVHQRLSESRTNGRTTTYQYDPLGRRLSKQTAGIVTHFLWDGDALLGDVDLASRRAASPTAQTREWVYYPGTFEPLVLVQRRADSFDDALYFYHNDPNGCPARLFDREGRIAWAARYGPWGEIDRSHSGRLDNPLRLQGQYADSETGLCYNRNRYYDASIGTFVSQDPLGLEPSENPYQFAQNVHAWIDPLGLACARPRSPHPIGRRFRFSTMKAAREAAERASPFGRAVKHIDPKHGPHFHPADDLGRPLNHDHYFFPKRFT